MQRIILSHVNFLSYHYNVMTCWHCNDLIGNLNVTIWYAASRATQKILAVHLDSRSRWVTRWVIALYSRSGSRNLKKNIFVWHFSVGRPEEQSVRFWWRTPWRSESRFFIYLLMRFVWTSQSINSQEYPKTWKSSAEVPGALYFNMLLILKHGCLSSVMLSKSICKPLSLRIATPASGLNGSKSPARTSECW